MIKVFEASEVFVMPVKDYQIDLPVCLGKKPLDMNDSVFEHVSSEYAALTSSRTHFTLSAKDPGDAVRKVLGNFFYGNGQMADNVYQCLGEFDSFPDGMVKPVK